MYNAHWDGGSGGSSAVPAPAPMDSSGTEQSAVAAVAVPAQNVDVQSQAAFHREARLFSMAPAVMPAREMAPSHLL